MDHDSSLRLLSVIILVALMYTDFCLAGFIETPSSMTVEFESGVDQTVVFRCRHERQDAVIFWKLNGSQSSLYPGVVHSFMVEMGARVDNLTVPVIPAYNNTVVVCTAFVGGAIEDSPAATLIITGSASIPLSPSVETTTTTNTTIERPTTVTVISATPAPTTTVGTLSTVNFEMIPSPLIVAIEEGVATFYCQHSTCDFIDWRVNGTSLNRLSSERITGSVDVADDGVRLYSLSFNTSLELSGSRVECVAIFYNGSPQQVTSPVTLHVQGVPGKVKNASLTRSHSSVNRLITEWDPLRSLDLTNTEPDIVYRIQLNKITCGQNVSMGEETVTGTSRSIVVDPHEIYEVTITPRNNVPLGRDGGSTVLREQFLSMEDHLFRLVRGFSIIFEDNSPVPSYYTMELESLDGLQSESTIMINTSRKGELVKLRLQRQLPSKRLWNVSVLAHSCEVDTVVEGFELSTHDIMNVSVFSTTPGEIRVSSNLINGSNATGVFLVVYSDCNTSNDALYSIFDGLKGDIHVDVTINVSTGGEYKVSVFALENGQPFPRVAALPRCVHVDTPEEINGLQQDSEIDYELQSSSTGVCITCTFLESSTATDCVAVVHQRISQLNSNAGLMNIESSHKFTRSGDTASGCIFGVNLEDYQVGVVGGTSEQGSKNVHFSCAMTCYVACAVGALIVVLLLTVCGITINFANKRMLREERNEHTHTENVATKRNEAYEITVLARQRVVMKENQAYEQVYKNDIM